MASSHQPGFPLEILHLDIVDKMATNLLKRGRWLRITFQYLESNSDLSHLLAYGILPQGIAVFTVDPDAIVVSLRNFDSKLMSPFVIGTVDRSDNPVTSSKGERHPPGEGWLVLNSMGDRIVSQFHWIRFLEVGQAFPRGAAVFPVDRKSVV